MIADTHRQRDRHAYHNTPLLYWDEVKHYIFTFDVMIICDICDNTQLHFNQ